MLEYVDSFGSQEIRKQKMARLNVYYAAPDPEPLVKLADITTRNDARLEELIEEFVRNREKELDKTDEVK